MKVNLLNGVPKEEAERAKGPLNSLLADPSMDYIRRAIELQKRKPLSADYDSPSWAYKQADQNGYNRAIDDVLNLIKG